jgi:hypothetical protein
MVANLINLVNKVYMLSILKKIWQMRKTMLLILLWK